MADALRGAILSSFLARVRLVTDVVGVTDFPFRHDDSPVTGSDSHKGRAEWGGYAGGNQGAISRARSIMSEAEARGHEGRSV